MKDIDKALSRYASLAYCVALVFLRWLGWLEFDRVAEAFEALHQPTFNSLLVTLIEVIRSKLPVWLTPRQHVIRNH